MKKYKFDLLVGATPAVRAVLEAISREVSSDLLSNYQYLDGIRFVPASSNLLKTVPWSDFYDHGAYVSGGREYCEYDRYYSVFVRPEGIQVQKLAEAASRDDRFAKEEGWAEEIGVQLATIERKPDFIVQVTQSDPYMGENRDGEMHNRFMTVHKMGKFPLASYLCGQVDLAAQELKQEIEKAFANK